ncbi:MAG TPA: amidase family protein, partial [Sedimentisphaerales bacterium]|nr:amidase family protein [Sedimentisphaerales bacterium]
AANLAGVPGMSVPCGFDGKGLPIGLQILGPAFSEAKILKIAHMFESKTDHHTKAPAIAG